MLTAPTMAPAVVMIPHATGRGPRCRMKSQLPTPERTRKDVGPIRANMPVSTSSDESWDDCSQPKWREDNGGRRIHEDPHDKKSRQRLGHDGIPCRRRSDDREAARSPYRSLLLSPTREWP